MMPSLPFAVLLLAAVLCSSFGGRRAFAIGMVIAADWVLYNAPWWGYDPATAIGLRYTDGWAVVDLLALIAVLSIAQWRWWGFAIAGILLVQIWIYALIDAGVAFTPASKALDALFLAQLTVLFMAGGRGCGGCLLHLWTIFHRLLRVPGRSPCEGG